MSVINTMLQDLDKRHGRSGGEAVAGDAVRSIKRESPWHLGRNTLIAIVTLLMVSLAGAWLLQRRNNGFSRSRDVAAAPPAPAIASQPASATSLALAATPTASARPTDEVAVAADLTVAVRAGASVPISQQVPMVSIAAAEPRPETASPGKLAALAPSPGTPAHFSTPPDKVDTPPPPPTPAPSPPPTKTAAMSANTAGGKTYSAAQLSANLLGEAIMLDRQGRQEEAKLPLQRALTTNPLDVQARQMLIQLHLDTGHVEGATALLAEGRRLLPEQSSFALGLARLKVDSGDVSGSIQILESGLASARDEPQYRAFFAALLLRVERYDAALQNYLVALRSDPANASWLVGVGVALEGVGKPADAAEAYRRADGAANLTPEVASFASERLKRLGR